MTSFRIPPKFLKALALFASRDATRYMLLGVFAEVTPTSVILVATDGRRLGTVNATPEVLEIECDQPEGFLIPSELISAMPQASEKSKGRVRVTFDGKEVSIHGKRKVSCEAAIGNYPNWRHVIPEPATAAIGAIYLNGSFLADFQKASALLYGESSMVLRQADEMSPMLLQSTYRNAEFIGVLMPMRTEPRQIPSWASTPISAPVVSTSAAA